MGPSAPLHRKENSNTCLLRDLIFQSTARMQARTDRLAPRRAPSQTVSS